jgi:hypothetical protein
LVLCQEQDLDQKFNEIYRQRLTPKEFEVGVPMLRIWNAEAFQELFLSVVLSYGRISEPATARDLLDVPKTDVLC